MCAILGNITGKQGGDGNGDSETVHEKDGAEKVPIVFVPYFVTSLASKGEMAMEIARQFMRRM